jgi:RNA-directed DNA polymerase
MIMMDVHKVRTVPIVFKQVVEAYGKVRRGGKAAGIDNESWTDFNKRVERNLFVIWARLSSGSYHPEAVREVEIPKKDGKMRKLGIPTLRDRIAQQVVKDYMEKRIDKLFHEDSYGYRPLKSAHQAINRVRKNCYSYDWVIDMDISKFFDEIDHELMLKAVSHVMEESWVKMYVERWLKMSVMKKDGTIEAKAGKGTPQGGVISPLLANLYLHYTLDVWLTRKHPTVSFVRYADDVVVHCHSKGQAEAVLNAIRVRLTEVKLAIKEEKTHIVYCKNFHRQGAYDNVKFEFLGFSFQPRARNRKRDGKKFLAFAAEISQSNQKKIRDAIKETVNTRATRTELSDIAVLINSKLRGWINYYGLFSKSRLRWTLQSLDRRLISLLMNKHKMGYRKASAKLKLIKEQNPKMFFHWEVGYG